MRFGPIEAADKYGRTVILRNAEPTDAADLIMHVNQTAAETTFLLREADEFQMTAAQEAEFIQSMIDNPRALLLMATVDGIHAGNCSIVPLGKVRRVAHRCDLSVALYRKFWGAGLGRILIDAALNVAKELGYEQIELEVVSENHAAVALYESFGFQQYGKFPHSMKYSDGTYADSLWMVKALD